MDKANPQELIHSLSYENRKKEIQKIKFYDLGLIDFKECWDKQEKLLQQTIAIKLSRRTSNFTPSTRGQTSNFLLFCEHPHVYTLGKSGSEKNFLLNSELLKKINASYYKINRGGDITYHGPGQLVGYPILDLEHFFTDIHKYLRSLEEVIILTLNDYGISAGRIDGLTGVWIDFNDNDKVRARKICAMGVRTSRWVTMHGFAFNVCPDLSYFNHIIPCGINDKEVTSMEKELGKKPDMNKVKEKVKKYFAEVFQCEISESPGNK